MNDFWGGLTSRARAGLIAGLVLIVIAMTAAGWWLLRAEYQVLFADLKPQDASVMTTELERLKIPFRVADGGTTIMVDKGVVHETRIKLMGKELSLNGAVGFELFNNTDFGMTEFAQKINYQRALQGELTRTIQALAEVRDVRVHLALPEQGLFKQLAGKAKAAVTLTMRQGQTLRPEQVKGIARLVAAAVPGMLSQDVTIVDNQGVVLSRPAGDAEAELTGARLELKRESDNYLSRKAGEVLDRAFGPGQALVSVDVTLNMDQIRVTTEEVIGAPSSARVGQPLTGVVVRERESIVDRGPPGDSKVSSDGSSMTLARSLTTSGTTQREVEYQVGRRVEQVVSQPGSIRRIQAVAVVRHTLDSVQMEQVRKMVAAAVGASKERGDEVVVQTLGGFPAQKTNESTAFIPAEIPSTQNAELQKVGDSRTDNDQSALVLKVIGVLLLVVVFLGAGWLYQSRSAVLGLKNLTANATRQSSLTEAQRNTALQQVQSWMQQSESGRSEPRNPAADGARI
jgi:flagellar M-ring protein FliF